MLTYSPQKQVQRMLQQVLGGRTSACIHYVIRRWIVDDVIWLWGWRAAGVVLCAVCISAILPISGDGSAVRGGGGVFLTLVGDTSRYASQRVDVLQIKNHPHRVAPHVERL